MSGRTKVLTVVIAALLLLGVMVSAVSAQASRTRLAWLIADTVTVEGDASVGDDLTVTDDASIGGDMAVTGEVTLGNDLSVTGSSTMDNIVQTINGVENFGVLPTVISATVAYTDTTALFTISDGEIWVVHDAFVKVTTNYDCTGDNCTFQVGDGGDANGLLDLVDAELQAAAIEVTGGAAGWYGHGAGSRGAYLNNRWGFVYAPSGAAETIDFDIGGTDPAGGAATIYIVYTRIQ